LTKSNHSDRSEVSLEKIAETSPITITRVDRNGRIVYANSRAEEILGLKKSEITDRTYNDPDWKITDFEGDDFPDEDLPFQVVKRTEEPVYNIKHAIEWPNGKRKLLSVNASPLFDDQGEFDGMIAYINDITRQINTNKALQASKSRYEQLIDNMSSGVAVYEPVNGGDHFVFREFNTAAEEIEDIDADRVIGKRLMEVFPSVEEFGLFEALQRVNRTGKPESHLTSHYEDERIDGWRSNYIYKLPSGEVVAIYDDITERKHLEEKREELISELGERYKELTLLYKVSQLSVERDNTLEEILTETVNLIPPAWQYPEVTCAKITYRGEEYKTEDFKPTKWEQTRDIVADGDKVGSIEVHYLEKKPEMDKGPFLDEEEDLINSLARNLGQIISSRELRRKKDHLNSVLNAVRNVNQMLIREDNREELIQSACDELIETRDYTDAWIALFDESEQFVTCAQSGLGAEFDELRRLLQNGDLPQRAKRALQQSGVITSDDPGSSCRDCPLAKNYKGRAALSVRLEYQDRIYGLLSASIPDEYIDSTREKSLIEEVADDIAFGLHDIEVNEKRKQAEEKFRQAVNLAPFPMMIYADDGQVVAINESWLEITGTKKKRYPLYRTGASWLTEKPNTISHPTWTNYTI
jgi:PAS domain S-box-containing protein